MNAVKFGKVRVKRIGQHFVVKLEHTFGNFHIYHIFEFLKHQIWSTVMPLNLTSRTKKTSPYNFVL